MTQKDNQKSKQKQDQKERPNKTKDGKRILEVVNTGGNMIFAHPSYDLDDIREEFLIRDKIINDRFEEEQAMRFHRFKKCINIDCNSEYDLFCKFCGDKVCKKHIKAFDPHDKNADFDKGHPCYHHPIYRKRMEKVRKKREEEQRILLERVEKEKREQEKRLKEEKQNEFKKTRERTDKWIQEQDEKREKLRKEQEEKEFKKGKKNAITIKPKSKKKKQSKFKKFVRKYIKF